MPSAWEEPSPGDPADADDVVAEDLTAPLVPVDLTQNSTSWRQLLTVEPYVLLLSTAVLLTSHVETTLYLTHTCRHVGFNQSTCAQLEAGGSSQVEALVQRAANRWVLAHLMTESLVPAVLAVFAGPWSDRRGRRTFLLMPILGYAAKFATLAALSGWPALAPYWLLLGAVPASLGGGWVLALSMCFCYVSDVSAPERRGFRMGFLEAVFYAGVLAGTLASTHLFGVGGYLASFATASALCVIATAYTAFWLAESVVDPQTDGCCLSGLADFRLVAAMFTTCRAPRRGHARAVLWLAIVALGLAMVSRFGEHGVGFLFARRKFAWDIQQYTLLSAASILMQVFCALCGIGLLSLSCRPDDAALAALAFLAKASAGALLALSPTAWWMYAGVAVGSLGALAAPLCRAVVSQSVPSREVGKALSLVSALEAVTPLAAAPLYTLLYNETLVVFPGAIFLLSTGLFAVDTLLLCVILCLQDNNSDANIPVNAE